MKTIGIDFTFESELDIEIIVTGYIHSRKAPTCSNPSSPLFSDCGDDAEFEDFKVLVHGFDITDNLPQHIIEQIIEQIHEEAEYAIQ